MSTSASNLDPLLERCAGECLARGWRLAWLMLRHRKDAADAVQSAFVVALRKRGQIPHDNPWPWLAAVIAREAMQIRRKRARVIFFDAGDSHMPEEPARGPLAELEHREREAQLAHALDELPAPERDALLLTQLGGLTYAQAAQSLGVPLGTFNHQVSRALAEMRKKLRKEEPAVARALAALPILAPPAGLRESLAASAAGTGGITTVAIGGLAMKKTTALIGALVLVLMLGVGAFTVMIWPDGDDATSLPVSKTEVPADNAGGKENATPPTNVDMRVPISPAFAPPASNAQPEGPKSDLQTRLPAESIQRVLVATDNLGKPVSANFVVDWRVSSGQEWVTQRVKTEADGRVQLEAPVEATVRVNLTDGEPDWILAWRDVTRKGGEVEAPVTVYSPVPLRVRVIYADNQPYVGLLRIEGKGWFQGGLQMVEAPGEQEPLPRGWPAYGERQLYGYHEFVNFAGVPTGIDVRFGTVATRTGYGEVERLVTAAEIASGKLIEIVIPQGVSSRTPATIAVTLPDGEKLEQQPRLYKILPDGSRLATWFFSPGFRDGKGPVRAGRYVMYFVGTQTWASEEFDLAPGETREFRPVFTEPASLSVRALDVDGKPVPGAVLAPASVSRPQTIQFDLMKQKDPNRRHYSLAYDGEAVTDVDGFATLKGFPAGTFKFQVYAIGFQPWEGFATLTAGQEQSLGEVRLERAAGRIEAQFPEWDFTKRKVNWAIHDELGGGSIASGTVTSSKLVVEGLPVGRTYSLKTHIPTSRGSQAFWYSRPFELTAASPSHKLDGTDRKWPENLD